MQKRFRLHGLLKLTLCLLISGWFEASGASLLVRGGTLIDGTGAAPIALRLDLPSLSQILKAAQDLPS